MLKIINLKSTIIILVGAVFIVGSFITWNIREANRQPLNADTIYNLTSTTMNNHPTTDAEWRKVLTPEQYYILREKGTERPYSHPFNNETRPGTYVTADCNEPVFRSEQKYNSGTGWPSFYAPITPDAMELEEDNDLFMSRTEVLSKCGGHLGHVFNDGPAPTGKRYCMNGMALKFIPDPPATTTSST